jgi:hypothetical protein
MNTKRINWAGYIIILLMVGSMLASACSSNTPKPTPTPGPLDFVKAYENAFNQHDLDAIKALFGPNIMFDMAGWDTPDTPANVVALFGNYYFGDYKRCRNL